MTTATRSVLGTVAGVFLLLVVFVIGIPLAALGVSADPGACGPGGTAQTVAEQHLDAEQLANAATIVAVAGVVT